MAPQVHNPHHYYLAWTLALLATGRNTQVMTLDSTVWIEASEGSTVFHSSNKSNYLRTTIPTMDGLGSEWREIVYDPYRQARDIASKCRAKNPDQETLIDRVITLTPGDDSVEIKLVDPGERTSMTTSIPTHDLQWPYDIIAEFDRHEADSQFSLGITPQFAAMFAGVTKLLGVTVPIAPDSGRASFSIEHPEIPEIKIEGLCATKSP